MTIISEEKGLNLSVQFKISQSEAGTEVKVFVYCMGCFLMMVLFLVGTLRLDSHHVDFYTRANMGYLSIVMMSVLIFTYFGVFVLLNLTVGFNLASFIIPATLVIMTSCSYKTAMVVFLDNKADDPRLQELGWRSIRGKFFMGTLFSMMLAYFLSVAMMPYMSFTYVVAFLSCYPLVQVGETCFRASKQCFSW